MGLRHLLCTLALLVPLGSRAQVLDAPRSLRVTLGAGAEGHTGNLGEVYEIGPVGAVAVALQPLPWVELELGYSVGLHQIDTGRDGGLVDGYDVVRQGPQLSLSLGPSLQGVRPYLISGVGLSWLNVRGPDDPSYRDDTDLYVPLGGGLSVTAGRVTLDARLSYHALFEQQSIDAPDGSGPGTGGRYQALVSLGLGL
jgi:hypothetical protein